MADRRSVLHRPLDQLPDLDAHCPGRRPLSGCGGGDRRGLYGRVFRRVAGGVSCACLWVRQSGLGTLLANEAAALAAPAGPRIGVRRDERTGKEMNLALTPL